MSIVDMQVMLHWYYLQDVYPDRSCKGSMPPAIKEAHLFLESQGLLRRHPDCREKYTQTQRFEATEKGRAYVNALEMVKLPVQRWEVPK